jgi:hypothetical protein
MTAYSIWKKKKTDFITIKYFKFVKIIFIVFDKGIFVYGKKLYKVKFKEKFIN